MKYTPSSLQSINWKQAEMTVFFLKGEDNMYVLVIYEDLEQEQNFQIVGFTSEEAWELLFIK